jgi:hypothetical protein
MPIGKVAFALTRNSARRCSRCPVQEYDIAETMTFINTTSSPVTSRLPSAS